MVILVAVIISLNIIVYVSFWAIDAQQKEAGKKLYPLGKLRFVLIHCGLETKIEDRGKKGLQRKMKQTQNQ